MRGLIHRPAVGSSLGGKAAPALIAVGESSKHVVQIIQLLEERSMSFSFCLNKSDVLVLCGTSLLYQSLDLKHESKLMKDVERLVNAVIKTLLKMKAPGTYDLKRVASLLITVDVPSQPTSMRTSPDTTMAAPPSRTSPLLNLSRKKSQSPYSAGRNAAATMSETDLLSQQEKLRRMTLPNGQTGRPELHRAQSRASLDMGAEQSAPRRDHRFSISQIQQSMMRMSPLHKSKQRNLDYLSLNEAPTEPRASPPTQDHNLPQPMTNGQQPQTQVYPPPQMMNKGGSGGGVSISEWEALLGAMDGGQINVYDAIYGGPALSITETPTTTATTLGEWSPDSWDLSNFNIGDLSANPAAPQSVLSISDDSLSSADDLNSNDMYLRMGSEDYQSGLMAPPRPSHDGNLVLEGLELNLGI